MKLRSEQLNPLLLAIVIQAIKDMKVEEFSSDASEFFQSPLFEDIIDELASDEDIASIQQQVLAGDYEDENVHAWYH